MNTLIRLSVTGALAASLVLAGSPASSTSPCGGLAPTLIGTPGDDFLIGTPGADVIDGLAGNDRILGLGGDDVICGGPGRDVVMGGDGDDFVGGGPSIDVLYGEGGHDRLNGQGEHDTLHGGDGDDILVGGPGRDRLHGDSGLDVLVGGPGADDLYGGGDDDIVRGGGADDKLFGGPGSDLLLGEAGHDVIDGLAGDDISSGGPGIDLCRQTQTDCERVSTVEDQLTTLVDEARASTCGTGALALVPHEGAAWAAAFHAWDMSAHDFFGHTSPTYGTLTDRLTQHGVLPGPSRWGEILAGTSSTGNTAQSLFDAWWDSPSHRSALCSPTLTQGGMGVVFDAEGGVTYAALDFVTP